MTQQTMSVTLRRAAPLAWRAAVVASVLGALIPLMGCGDKPAAPADGPMSVYVTIPPQAYFVERVGGEHVSVGVLIGPGQSPHTFEPTARQMAAVSAARVYFAIGAPFERRVLQRLGEASPDVRIVNTAEGVPRRTMEPVLSLDAGAATARSADRGATSDEHAGHEHAGHEHAGHDHAADEHGGRGHAAADHAADDPAGQGRDNDDHAGRGRANDDHAGQGHASDDHAGHGHAAGEPDPHVWLSPKLVKLQARRICEALREAAPRHAAAFDENLRRFEADLDAVDAEIAGMLAPYRGRAVLVFHPAYGYFTDAYGLRQVSIEIEGKAPGPRQLAELVTAARARGVRVIFIQPQISAQQAEAVAGEIGARVVTIDPMERDFLNNLRRMAEAIAAALAAEGG